MCKARRMNDQMMCECGLAWDMDDEAPECPRSRVVKCDGYSTDEHRPAYAVTDAMIDKAMFARMPGGSAAWVWLFNCEGGMCPEQKHRDWFRRVLEGALK